MQYLGNSVWFTMGIQKWSYQDQCNKKEWTVNIRWALKEEKNYQTNRTFSKCWQQLGAISWLHGDWRTQWFLWGAPPTLHYHGGHWKHRTCDGWWCSVFHLRVLTYTGQPSWVSLESWHGSFGPEWLWGVADRPWRRWSRVSETTYIALLVTLLHCLDMDCGWPPKLLLLGNIKHWYIFLIVMKLTLNLNLKTHLLKRSLVHQCTMHMYQVQKWLLEDDPDSIIPHPMSLHAIYQLF